MDPKAQALQKIALRCKTDLYFLCKEILGYDKMEVHTHQELCNYTTSILSNPPELPHDPNFDPRKNLLLLLMPRGTFKSSVVTIGFTLQYILNEPDTRILLDSETFGKSKAFLREIIEHLTNNEIYREIFKAIHGVYPYTKKSDMKLWTDSEIILPCRRRPLKEPSISCMGIDTTRNGMHYDLIIADDLHSEKNVTSKDMIQQVIDHYKLAFSLLDPGKPMIVIGTRWHELDLYGHIIDFEQQDFNVLKKAAYNSDGSLFFPEVLTEKELDKIRRRQGTSIFSKQYLNEPVSDENATFKSEQFKDRIRLETIMGRPINWYWLIDPSYTDPRSTGVYSDYAGFVLAGIDYQREYFVRYCIRQKMTYSDIINRMFELYSDPRFKDIKKVKFILEVIGTKSLSYELATEQRRRNTWLPVTEIKARHDNKEERIRGLAPVYENHKMHHIIECPQLEELEMELIQFPTGRHDDLIDPLATLLEVASPPTNKGTFDDGYEYEHDFDGNVIGRKKHKRLAQFKPRSRLTGV